MQTKLAQPLLSVQNFTLEYKTRKGYVSAVNDVSFDLLPGQAMGLDGFAAPFPR